MKMPRFTAEASLYKTNENYRMVASTKQATMDVGPALLSSCEMCFERCFLDPGLSVNCYAFCRPFCGAYPI
jgi:hypothetical protein